MRDDDRDNDAIGATLPADAPQDTGRPGSTAFLGELAEGDKFAHFVVRELLGRGGMGVVYLAHDPTLDRNVAIKLIHPNALDAADSLSARLLQEAKAMSKVAHPNVITVHEAGIFDRQVFIATEYVDGGTLADWLQSEKRSTRDIVRVFIQAGRGLAAAHAAGLVHRDFKPSNVMVGVDSKVRVMDFGLAALAAGAPTEAAPRSRPVDVTPALTHTGALVGTPRYMSPEQHQGQRAGPEADQFAFSVSLYEALAGRPPFPGGSLTELRSQVLSESTPAPLDKVPSWLAKVVLRGLDKDKSRRFPSMDALLAALEKGPLVTPRRVLGVAAVLAVGGLSVGGALMLTRAEPPCRGAEKLLAHAWDPEARRAMERAFTESKKPDAADMLARVTKRLDEHSAAWVAMRTDACEATAVRREQSAAVLDLRMACLDQRLSELRAFTELLSRPENVSPRAVAAVLRLGRLEDCADKVGLAASERPPPADKRLEVEALRHRLERGRVFTYLGKVKAATQEVIPLVADVRKLGWPPLLGETLGLASVLQAETDPNAAMASIQEALVIGADTRNDALIAKAQVNLIYYLGVKLSRRAEALAMGPVAAASIRRVGNPDHLQAELAFHLGFVLERDGKYAEAEAKYEVARAAWERSDGPGSVWVGRAHSLLAQVQGQLERLEDARRNAERALAIFEAQLGPDSFDVGTIVNELGGLAWRVGDLDNARRHYERAHAVLLHQLGDQSPAVGIMLENLGNVAREQGRLEEAHQMYERGLAIRSKVFGPDSARTVGIEVLLGRLLVQEGRLAEARPMIEHAVAVERKELGPDHSELGDALTIEAELRIAEKSPAAAVALLEEALGIFERSMGKDHESVRRALVPLGDAYLAAHRAGDAVRVLERAHGMLRPDTRADQAAETRFALARALRAARADGRRAESLAQEARAYWNKAGRKTEVEAVDRWLAGR